MLPAPTTNLSRRSGVPLDPLQRNQPNGTEPTDPDHITMIPLGSAALLTLFDTKAVVATCVLLVPLAAVGAVTTPDSTEVPLTESDDSVPRLVILGCAAVVSVPEIPPDTVRAVSVPTEVMLGCAAVVIDPLRLVAATFPATVKAVRVPRLVMLGCAAVDNTPLMPPETVSDESVPTEVMLGWAAVLRVPCMAPLTESELNVPTLVILGWAAVRSCPVSVVAVTDPVTMELLTLRVVSVPISLMLG